MRRTVEFSIRESLRGSTTRLKGTPHLVKRVNLLIDRMHLLFCVALFHQTSAAMQLNGWRNGSRTGFDFPVGNGLANGGTLRFAHLVGNTTGGKTGNQSLNQVQVFSANDKDLYRSFHNHNVSVLGPGSTHDDVVLTSGTNTMSSVTKVIQIPLKEVELWSPGMYEVVHKTGHYAPGDIVYICEFLSSQGGHGIVDHARSRIAHKFHEHSPRLPIRSDWVNGIWRTNISKVKTFILEPTPRRGTYYCRIPKFDQFGPQLESELSKASGVKDPTKRCIGKIRFNDIASPVLTQKKRKHKLLFSVGALQYEIREIKHQQEINQIVSQSDWPTQYKEFAELNISNFKATFDSAIRQSSAAYPQLSYCVAKVRWGSLTKFVYVVVACDPLTKFLHLLEPFPGTTGFQTSRAMIVLPRRLATVSGTLEFWYNPIFVLLMSMFVGAMIFYVQRLLNKVPEESSTRSTGDFKSDSDSVIEGTLSRVSSFLSRSSVRKAKQAAKISRSSTASKDANEMV